MGDIFRTSEYRFRVNQNFDFVYQILRLTAEHATAQPGAWVERSVLESAFVVAGNPAGPRVAGSRKEDNERDDLTSNVRLCEALQLIDVRLGAKDRWQATRLRPYGAKVARCPDGSPELHASLCSRMLAEVKKLPLILQRLSQVASMSAEDMALTLGVGDLVMLDAMTRLLVDGKTRRGAIPLLKRTGKSFVLARNSGELLNHAWRILVAELADIAYSHCRLGEYAVIEDICDYFRDKYCVSGAEGRELIRKALVHLATEQSGRYHIEAYPGRSHNYFFRVAGS